MTVVFMFQVLQMWRQLGKVWSFLRWQGILSDFHIVYPNFSFTFTKITHLDIPSSKVTEFPQMTQAHNLIRLNLNNNQIKMLPNISGLGFPEVNVLKEFYFTNNQLEMPVAPHVWTGFPNLVTLDLRNSRNWFMAWSSKCHKVSTVKVEWEPNYYNSTLSKSRPPNK